MYPDEHSNSFNTRNAKTVLSRVSLGNISSKGILHSGFQMTNHSAFGNYGKIRLPSLARNVNDQI